jgi:phosphoglycolate phosphatase
LVLTSLYSLSPSARFHHFIFDLDGTLLDTKEDLAAATNYVLSRFGLPAIPPERVRGYVGHGVRVLVQRALGESHRHLVHEGQVLFLEYYREHLLDHTQPYPGIVQLLGRIKDGGGMISVLTNKPEEFGRHLITGLGLSDYFIGIVGGDTLTTRKPDPLGVYHLQQLSGVSLQRTLLIGDSETDVETAQAAGVAICGVTWGFGEEGLKACLERGRKGSPTPLLIQAPDELLSLVSVTSS